MEVYVSDYKLVFVNDRIYGSSIKILKFYQCQFFEQLLFNAILIEITFKKSIYLKLQLKKEKMKKAIICGEKISQTINILEREQWAI